MWQVLAGVGLVAAGIGAYLFDQKKHASGGSGGTPSPSIPKAKVIPRGSPEDVPSNPFSPSANEIAHKTQPPPPGQPPLPPAPPPETVPPGTKMIVTTKEEGQAGALRVRSQPSTTANPIPDGEPASGGGIPHGASLIVDGPMNAGFLHVRYSGSLPSGKNATLDGWAWAGYMTKA